MSEPLKPTIAAPESVTWNREKLNLFKAATEDAVNLKRETFMFDGHEFIPAYAKYLIQYLETQL